MAAPAVGDEAPAGSTLASQVAPVNDFSAARASMVDGRLIADVQQTAVIQTAAERPSTSKSSEPAKVAARRWSGGGWRPAGSGGSQQSRTSSHPAPPAPPAANESFEPSKSSGKSAQKPGAADAQRQAAKANEEDLAPIDELSETPAPADDAPGDPVEPEYTGPALPSTDASTPSLELRGPMDRPQRGAAKLGDAAMTPIGEPDRIAPPSQGPPRPSNPEDYVQDEPAAPVGKLRPLTRNQRMLRDKIRSVLKHYYARPHNTGDRSPWEVMHSMLAYEVHSRVLQGGPQGESITAVGWLCFNQPCKNRTLMYLNEEGALRVKVGPALQGHHGQLLALLAQARVRSDYPMQVDGKDFTIADLIEMEKATCYPRTELTFKLIGLQRYLDIDASWLNDQGMQWDFPTLMREEMRQPVRTAACGGTHRLSGLSLAVKKRQASGMPLNGAYAEASKFVANYQNYAYRLQNSDGSFSTEWFKGPGTEADIDRRLKTTGHTLEWLLYTASEEQLTYYRTVRAVNYLTNIMHANRTRDWEAGPLGHAIHALVLYDRLAFAKYDENPSASPVAERPQRAKR